MPPITGWFDPSPKGGALRVAANSYLPAKGDPSVRLPGLRRGDLIVLDDGRVTTVNGEPAGQLDGRPDFANLGAVHPNRALTLETPNASSPRTAETQRVVDLICPFGFGQRALIVSPPKAGKTMMLQAIAESVAENHPKAVLLILLVDERPEEGSEMIRWRRQDGRHHLRGVQGHGQRRAAAYARAGGPANLSRGGHRGERHTPRRAAR